LPVLPIEKSLQVTLARLEEQRSIVDRNLVRPACWRGYLRREFQYGPRQAERARVAETFNWLTDERLREVELSVTLLREVHDRAVGGREFRTNWSSVDRQRQRSEPRQISERVEQLFAEVGVSDAPAPLVASKLHLQLLRIHPFADGNGRTTRLLASFVMMRAGYRSTLFTAIEEQVVSPPWYMRAFEALDNGRMTPEGWLKLAIRAMAQRSFLIAWLRARSERLYTLGRQLGLTDALLAEELVRFDFGKGCRVQALAEAMQHEEPWSQLRPRLPYHEAVALCRQLRRLRVEERSKSDE